MAMSKDEALIEVILERFNNIRFPRARDIKEKIEKGETLNEFDIEFFKEVFDDIKNNLHLVEADEELQSLVAKFIQFNEEITEKALENEKHNNKLNF